MNLDDVVFVSEPMGKDSTIGKVNRLSDRRFRGTDPCTPDTGQTCKGKELHATAVSLVSSTLTGST